MAPKSREVYLIEGDIVATHDSDKGDPRLYEKEYNYEDALDIIGLFEVLMFFASFNYGRLH